MRAGDGESSVCTSLVAGMHGEPAHTAHDGRQFGVQIMLDPLAAVARRHMVAGPERISIDPSRDSGSSVAMGTADG